MHTERRTYGGMYTWRRHTHEATTKQRNLNMEGTYTRRVIPDMVERKLSIYQCPKKPWSGEA